MSCNFKILQKSEKSSKCDEKNFLLFPKRCTFQRYWIHHSQTKIKKVPSIFRKSSPRVWDLEITMFISKKQKFPRRTYLLPSSFLVVAKSTMNFFSSWANYSCCFWTSLLPCWFEKQAAVKYRSAYLWKHASCKLFPFGKLYCFGLDKKAPFHEIWD